jgi:hypothetical protein
MTCHSSLVTRQIPLISPVLLSSALLLGCAGAEGREGVDSAGVQGADAGVSFAPGLPGRRGLSADFLQRRLTFVDLDKVVAGASRGSAQTSSLDLAAYPAPPLNVEITPDAKLALVSLSAGFFSIPGAGFLIGAASIPSDPGKLLFLDLEQRRILGELDTGAGPMGVAFTPDGARAFVCHFSTEQVAIVDVAARRVIEHVQVGPFSEEIALDESGSVGVLSYSSAGNVRTFATADMASSLSPSFDLSGDAAGVAFFPGTKIAYVVQAPMPLLGAQGGHTLLDVSDPSSPKLLEDVRDPAAPVAYPIVAVPPRNSLVVPIAADGKLSIREIVLEGHATRIAQTLELGSAGIFGAYGVTWISGDRVLLSVPASRSLISVDLASGEHFELAWESDAAGPTDLAVF